MATSLSSQFRLSRRGLFFDRYCAGAAGNRTQLFALIQCGV